MQKIDWNLEGRAANMYKQLEQEINSVFSHCRQGSIKTRHRYMDGMHTFGKYLADEFGKTNLRNISPKHIHGYVETLQDARYAKSTIQTHLSGIRFFVDNHSGSKMRKSDIPTNKELGVEPRTQQERIGSDKTWTNEQYDRMIDLAKERGHKDYAYAMQVGKEDKMRIHEVGKITVKSVENAAATGKITIVGKNGRSRTVDVKDPKVYMDLAKYCKEKGLKGSDKVFTEEGKTHKFLQSLKSFIYDNRIDKETFHGLRHTGTKDRYEDLIRKGWTEKDAMKKLSLELGHNRLSVTKIYLESNSESEYDAI